MRPSWASVRRALVAFYQQKALLRCPQVQSDSRSRAAATQTRHTATDCRPSFVPQVSWVEQDPLLAGPKEALRCCAQVHRDTQEVHRQRVVVDLRE